MTATDELRRMLDERGVEWIQGRVSSDSTAWLDGGAAVVADEYGDGLLLVERKMTPEQAIEATVGAKVTGDTSDGYHTFNELYHHRAVLFSVIVRDHKELAWKSRHHHDGSMYDGMFIVGVDTPRGQATYHYDVDPYWDMFDCRELDRAPEWDGHSPSDAIDRIAALGRGECHAKIGNGDAAGWWVCSECGELFDSVGTIRRDRKPSYCPNCGRRVVK